MSAAPRTAEGRARDVREILRAARSLAARADRIVPEITKSTGLSPEGVHLALREHLELEATDDDISALVARAGDATRVHVVLSSSVFVGAVRALAIARAAAPHVTLRPSTRDPWFARALVEELGSSAVQVEDVRARDLAAGEIHVYGRDATIAAIRAEARRGVRVVGHGAGMGVAWVAADDDLAEAAEAVARDVVPFDQRGCLSPRLALVEGDDARAVAFAAALDLRLAAWEARVPRGVVGGDEVAERVRWLETMAIAGVVLAGPAHAVAVAAHGSPLTLAPVGRNMHIAPIAMANAAAQLAPLASAIVAVGANDSAVAARIGPPHARVSRLGHMQRPRLDGPVDRRDR